MLGEFRMNSRVRGVMAARSCSGVTLNSVLSVVSRMTGVGAGELDHFRIAQPIRRGNDHFIAFLAGGEDDVVAGMLAAAGDDDLTGLVSEAVFAFELVGDGLAQFRDAAGGRVFREPSVSALMAASLMCCGVSKSGSPAPKPTTSWPSAFICLALESMARVSEGRARRRVAKSYNS